MSSDNTDSTVLEVETIKVSPKTLMNTIKNILVNDFGMTRDSIREIVREFVAETVRRYLDSRSTQGDWLAVAIRDEIRLQLNTALRGGRSFAFSSDTTIQKMVLDAINAEIKKQVLDRVVVTFKEAPNAVATDPQA